MKKNVFGDKEANNNINTYDIINNEDNE